MKRLILFLFLFLFLFNYPQNDSITNNKNKFPYKEFILPSSLIVLGSLSELGSIKEDFKDDVISPIFGNNFNKPLDDYLQYAPIVTLIGADLLTNDRKNTIWNQSKYFIISNLMSGALTWGLKTSLDHTRPNGSNHAFPSGHTTLAFTNATILFEEYKDKNLWIAYSGYIFAISTGVLRMANNKHWISDVLVGAGIGIGIVKLVYWIEPLKNWQPFKNKNISVFPNYQENTFLIGLNYKF